ncbi:MAG TPA: AmmeMemoRadiSam system protein B [Gemmataceae bacterium]
MTTNPPSIDLPARPRLRPGLAAVPDERAPGWFYLLDQLRLGGPPVRLTGLELMCAELLTGLRDLRAVQSDLMQRVGGILIPLGMITELVAKLDAALFLDSPRFRERLAGPVREPSCIGCYPPDPDAIRKQLSGLFAAPGGPGIPNEPGCRAGEGPSRLRAVLVPHMDYNRGGVTYGWGFRELVERTDARLFVIIGTAHYSAHRFTLTRKHFKTPLGLVETDQGYIDRIVSHYGDGLFDDPIAHLPEHSIELEVLLLQFLFGGRPFRIVPLVVGSFQDSVGEGTDPGEKEDVRRMIESLRRAEAEAREPVCYVISGDLAHIGPKFGDAEPVGEKLLIHSRNQDEAILDRAERADVAGYFRLIAQEGDARRICGLPPTYTALGAAQPRQGKRLHYGRYIHPKGFESVSFASVAFYG